MTDTSRGEATAGRPFVGPPWLARVRDVIAGHPQAADLGFAVMLMVLVSVRSNHVPVARIIVVLLCLPLVWRRRYPLTVFGFQCVVALVQWSFGFVHVADVALLVGLYTVAAHCARKWAIAAAGVLEFGVGLSVIRWWTDNFKSIPTFVLLSGMVTAAFVLGVNLRTRRAYLASLEDRALRAELERDQQSRIAAAGERARIAREMHDIVAHNLSVMIALADGAAYAARTGSPQAESAARQVSDTGRQALAEMQRLLGVLRSDDGDTTTRAPQPGIDQLDELIAQVRATGLAASLTVSGRPFALPTTAQLAVYRVVQEALTNVLKHATAPNRAQVNLRYEESELQVDVIDDGAPAVLDPARPFGHGLAGMRERAALFGGEVAAGPVAGGGWRVALRMSAAPLVALP